MTTTTTTKEEDNVNGNKADDHTVRGHGKQRRKRNLQQQVEGETTIAYLGEYASGDPSYSNQNVGDGYAIPDGGYGAVRQSVIDMILTNNQDWWAADFAASPAGLGSVAGSPGNYGGLFMRLAWHCNGSYRDSDGRGGCDGGSIRFPPISNWADNHSLNMALDLLHPVKELYGDKLSWGDLVVLAADASMVSMGGPVIGFCGGRIDWSNGDQALPLGPSVIQQELMPCGKEQCPEGEVCPDCVLPLGTAAVGLIYVEPVGTPEGEFEGTAQNIREVFGRMNFDDRMTVAAIGGGHAFGKSHGPCLQDKAIDVCQSPENSVSAHLCEQFCPDPTTNSTEPPYSWLQKSGSGLEVTWTRNPTVWDNEYFTNLFDYTWESYEGPGGHLQWKPEFTDDVQMFTTDLALAYGDPIYEEISREYAKSLTNLTRDFGTAWYQLMSRDVGPRSRCLGDELPPMQPWELTMGPVDRPLTTPKPDYIPVRSAIQKSIDDEPSNIAAFATLARQCASTFRSSDYQGGCNGAAIRFPPSIDWPTNEGAAEYLQLLEPIKDTFPDVSWSDLIVLAGQTAIEEASGGSNPMPFCGGRSDSENGSKAHGLEPRMYNNNTYDTILYDIANKGMSLAEGVALMATPDPKYYKLDGGDADDSSTGSGSSVTASVRAATTSDAGSSAYTLSNQFFVRMKESSSDTEEQDWFKGDIANVAEQFINDNDYFLEQYTKAYNYLMTADLFDGPTRNACQDVNDFTLVGQTASPSATPGSEDSGDNDSDSSTSTTTPGSEDSGDSDSDSSTSTTTEEEDTSTSDSGNGSDSDSSTTGTTIEVLSAATTLTNSNSHAASVSSAFVALLAAVWIIA